MKIIGEICEYCGHPRVIEGETDRCGCDRLNFRMRVDMPSDKFLKLMEKLEKTHECSIEVQEGNVILTGMVKP